MDKMVNSNLTRSYTVASFLNFLPILFAIFAGYVVIGGIWSGEITILKNIHPLVPLSLLFVVIILIGLLEGLQMGVATLEKKDLSELTKGKYPKAYKIHAKVRFQEDRVMKFLSGRQFLIVFLVFLSSRLTTFPHMSSFPFTDVSFPSWASPWFEAVFLKFGLLGAFFVYWVGNLTSQLIANSYPVMFLGKTPGLSLLFNSCIFLHMIRFSRPSELLVSIITKNWNEKYSMPEEENYKRELEFNRGFAVSNMKYNWEFGYRENPGEFVKVTYEAVFEVGRENVSEIWDNITIPMSENLKSLDYAAETTEYVFSLVLDGDEESMDHASVPEKLKTKFEEEGHPIYEGTLSVIENGVLWKVNGVGCTYTIKKIDGKVVVSKEEERVTIETGGGTEDVHFRLTKPQRTFSEDERIMMSVVAVLGISPEELSSSEIKVSHPTKQIVLEACCENVCNLAPITLKTFNPSKRSNVPSMVKELPVHREKNPVTNYSEVYPREGKLFKINWKGEYMSR